MDKSSSEEHRDVLQQSILESAVLHLLPGALTTLLYVITAPLFNSCGYPSNLAFLLGALAVLVPFELGFLLYQGKRRNGIYALDGIVLYRKPMTIRQYVIFSVILLLYGNFVLVVLYPPVAQMLIENWFSWLPDWFFLSLASEYPRPILLMTALVGLVLNGFVGPVTEELYFRGYLLPRISRLNVWAPVLNAVLHSVYHFWMPWQVPGLILGLLPAAFAVWWKKNIYLGMIIHVTGNVLGSVATLASILSLT